VDPRPANPDKVLHGPLPWSQELPHCAKSLHCRDGGAEKKKRSKS